MDNENTVFKSLAIIEENIREKLTVERLAESMHFSKYHYQRIFKEAVGDSVMRYVTKRKLTLAAAELVNTDDSILDIALKYGYDSHEGFSRSFKALMGITPKEYRKYYSSVGSPIIYAEREKSAMMYSKATNAVIRELNGLIVQTKETAVYLRENKACNQDIAGFYSDFWNYIADKTDVIADKLTKTFERLTADAARPDEITARFIIIKTVDDALFQLNLINFQTQLTISRAKPEHRPCLTVMGDRLSDLHLKPVKISVLFSELLGLIFNDIRKNAEGKLREAVKKGGEAVKKLEECSEKPYAYIKDEIEIIVKELSFESFEKITAELLEDYIFRLDIISFSADIDILRSPSDQPLFDGIADFKEQLSETVDFYRSLSEDIIASFEGGNKKAFFEGAERKRRGDSAFEENIILFYLKGEVQKLGTLLNDNQKAVFEKVFEQMNTVIRLAQLTDVIDSDTSYLTQKEMATLMREIYSELTAVKEELGERGSAVGFIAERIRQGSIGRCIREGVENFWL